MACKIATQNTVTRYVLCIIMGLTVLSKSEAHTNKTYLNSAAGQECITSYEAMRRMSLKTGPQSFLHTILPDDAFAEKVKESKKGQATITYSFYQSLNKNELGRYFGCNNSNSITVGNAFSTNPNASDITIHYPYLIHHASVTGDSLNTKITLTLQPKTIIHTLSFNGYYNLEKFVKTLFVALHVPFHHIQNTTGFRYSVNSFDPDEDSTRLKKYLRGDYSSQESNRLQAKLTHAKITDTTLYSTGPGDLHITVGSHALTSRLQRSTISMSGIIPAGDRVKSMWLYEPIRGNGGFWGVTLAGEYAHTLTEWRDHNIEARIAANLTYLIPNTQKRTIGLFSHTDNRLLGSVQQPWSHYYLLGKNGESTLIPAANELTRDLRVTPGIVSTIEGALAYTHKTYSCELGYRLQNRASESVSLKNNWPENTYGTAHRDYNTETPFSSSDIDDYEINPVGPKIINGQWLSQQDLNFEAAQTPAQTIHTLWGAIAKTWDIKCFLFVTELGVSDSIISQNAGPEGLKLWLSLNIKF